MKTAVVVDGNNLAYGIYSRVKESRGGLLHSSTGIPTTVIFGFMRSLNAFAKMVGSVDRVIIAWDVGGGSKMRKEIFPEYKVQRSYNDMDDYFAELKAAREYLPLFGIGSAPCQGIEADDAIGYYARKYLKQGYRTIIYSNDKDYYQLLRPNLKLKIWRPITDEMLDCGDVATKLGHDPRWLPRLQALTGQQKDNIPGACDLDDNGKMQLFGFGPAKAKKVLFHDDGVAAVCLSLKEARQRLKEDSPVNEDFTKQLLRNWKQVKLSYKLSKIRSARKEYSEPELQALDTAWDAASEIHAKKYRVSDWALHAEMLDIKSIPVAAISRALGVQVKGKDKVSSSSGRGRIKVKV